MDEEKPPPVDPPSDSEDTPPPPPPAEEPPPSPTNSGGIMDPPSIEGLAPGQGSLSADQDKQFAMLGHILPIVPLIILFTKADQSPFLKDQSQEATNFQISAAIVLGILSALTSSLCFPIILLVPAWIAAIVFAIQGALKSKEGIAYRYPFCARLLK